MELKPFQPTPEQIALSEQRRLKKLQAHTGSNPDTSKVNTGRFAPRAWQNVESTSSLDSEANDGCVKIMTWNLLAQTLVRRTMFPTSDCLKASQRGHMIYNELTSQNAHIITLQEVDRLEQLLPVLERAGYSHTFAAGPRKKHGCLIAYDKTLYTKIDERVILYDEQEVGPLRRGITFRTTNIGSIVALKGLGGQDGVIVATTHLFWHGKYTYERTRQAGILIREVLKFQTDINQPQWPCIVAGDFNFAPNDPAYSLMVGESLIPEQEESLALSRVVHVSIDPSVPATGKEEEEGGDEQGAIEVVNQPHEMTAEEKEEARLAKHPSRIITNARLAVPDDGLLTTPELIDSFSLHPPLKSAYDVGQRLAKKNGADLRTYGNRVDMPLERLGSFEPEWTSYTHYWKTVLDYIFIIDPPDKNSVITGFLIPHSAEVMHPGLPRKDVCGSDHTSLCAELYWKPKDR